MDGLQVPGFRGSGVPRFPGSKVPGFLNCDALRYVEPPEPRNFGTPEPRNPGTLDLRNSCTISSYGIASANGFDALSRLRDPRRRERRGLLQLRASQSGALGVFAAAAK